MECGDEPGLGWAGLQGIRDLIYVNFKQNTIRTFFKIYLFDSL